MTFWCKIKRYWNELPIKKSYTVPGKVRLGFNISIGEISYAFLSFLACLNGIKRKYSVENLDKSILSHNKLLFPLINRENDQIRLG